MKKKVMKVVIIISIIVFLAIFVEILLRNLTEVSEQKRDRKEQEEQRKAYEQTEQYQMEVALQAEIDTLEQIINSGDYDTLYASIDETYKDFKDISSSDDLKADFEEYLTNPVGMSLIKFYPQNGKYICVYSVLNGDTIEYKTLLMGVNEDGTKNYILDDMLSIDTVELQEKLKLANIEINFVYEARYPDKLVYTVDLTNTTTKTIKGSFEDTRLYKYNRVHYKPINTEELKVEIAPNETIRINMEFDDSDALLYDVDNVDVCFTDSNGKKFERDLFLTMDEILYDYGE